LNNGSKLKLKKESRRLRHTLQRKKRQERKAYRFLDGLTGRERTLQRPDTETMIGSAAQFQRGGVTLLVIETVSDHPVQEADPALLPGDAQVELRDPRVQSILIDMYLVLQAVDAVTARRYEVLQGNERGADLGIETGTGTGTETRRGKGRADAAVMMKNLDVNLTHEVGVAGGIRVETETVRERGAEVAVLM
jgi:hypothetical protein